MYWSYLREEEFDEAVRESKGVCVMPVGCLEMHGQHLPVGTDILIASQILRRASELEPVCVFPDFTFGDVQGHTTQKGGVRLTAELELRLMTELCAEIARNGFKKILLFNSHGGNTACLHKFVRSTMHDKKDYVVLTHFIQLATPQLLLELLETRGRDALPELTEEDIEVLRDYVRQKTYGGHACFSETAAMLGCCPELVRMDKIHALSGLNSGRTRHLDEAGLTASTRFWGVAYPNAYAGHAPEGCNTRIGQAAVRVMAENLARTLRVLKEDEEILKWNEEWNSAW